MALDGRPAVEVYAEALGLEPVEISSGTTGRHPLGYRFRGRVFPCSIVRTTARGHLQMAYSVEVGERMNLLEPGDLVEQSRQALDEVLTRLRDEGGAEPAGLLLFHCLGRYQEGQHDDSLDELFQAMDRAPICGLNTYGEQFWSMHMNHSLTGIAFGNPASIEAREREGESAGAREREEESVEGADDADVQPARAR